MIQDISTNEFVSGVINGQLNDNDVHHYCENQPYLMALFKSLMEAAADMIKSKGIDGGYGWNLTGRRFDFDNSNDLRLYTDAEFVRLQNAMASVCDLIEKRPTDERPPLTAQHNSGRRKGRPTKPFKAIMLNDEDGEHLKKIHAMMDGKSGKDAALIMLACIKKGWITKPTHAQVTNEFGDIGTKQNFAAYLNPNKYTNEELEGAINSLD